MKAGQAVEAGQAREEYDDDDLALADGELVDGPARPAVYKLLVPGC